MTEADLIGELLDIDFKRTEALAIAKEERRRRNNIKKREEISNDTMLRNAERLIERKTSSCELRKKMAMHGITQNDVAAVLNHGEATICRWFGYQYEEKKEILEKAVDAIIQVYEKR